MGGADWRQDFSWKDIFEWTRQFKIVISMMMADESNCTYFLPHCPIEWRQWLGLNASLLREIWLLFPKNASERHGISYLEALEEALCFGWIDGIVRRYGEDSLARRFTPRAAKSCWSEVNKHHARLLIESGKMTTRGIAVLPDLNPESYAFPGDIVDILRKDDTILQNFCTFPRFYQNIRIAAIDVSRHRRETFEKRLHYFLMQTLKNRRYGRFK